MKRNDSGDFCVLYVEPTDERTALFNSIVGQKKPVVLMLAEQTQVFQRPEDFTALKHVKRQMDVPIIFVIPRSERLTGLAGRNGFPVYLSMDALANALTVGQSTRSRPLNRATTGSLQAKRPSGPIMPSPEPVLPTVSTAPTVPPAFSLPTRNTVPLAPSSASTSPITPPPATSPSYPAYRYTPRRTVQLNPLDAETDFSSQRTTPLPDTAPLGPRPEPPSTRKKPGHMRVALVILVCLALAGAGLGSFLVVFRKSTNLAPPPVLVGHVYFLSSEQLSENNNQGLNDQVQINLTNIPAPAAHNNYYVWLLSDKNQSDTKAISLGALQFNKGNGHLFYAGDQQHTNLLAMDSRFLVTEEDATVPPIAPSPDESKWRFYGEFSQTPISASDPHHYSYLDHVRHLLAADPTLDELELPGGLNNWFYRNMGKIIEWTTSTREHWEETNDVEFIRRQAIRTLAYLDGLSYVRMDLPNDTPLGVNERLARVGLLDVAGPNQDPPSYLGHIVLHLNGLMESTTSTPSLHNEAASIVTALNNVRYWLTKVRQDAVQLARMSDQQLAQASTLSLINDMIDNANNAYVGQSDPASGQMREGVIWAHDHLQALASIDVNTITGTSSSIQLIQDVKHVKAITILFSLRQRYL